MIDHGHDRKSHRETKDIIVHGCTENLTQKQGI